MASPGSSNQTIQHLPLTMSVPIRVRGPGGISTIQVDLEGPVEDLQRAVFDSTQAGLGVMLPD